MFPKRKKKNRGDWRDHILDEMKEAEEAAKKNMPSKEERGVKTDDSKEMSEADCRELWKLIKEMNREFREMKQIADEWLMVNGRKRRMLRSSSCGNAPACGCHLRNLVAF